MINKIAEQLEEQRIAVNNKIEEIKADVRLSQEYKQELIKELILGYSEQVEKANEKALTELNKLNKLEKNDKFSIEKLKATIELLGMLKIVLTDDDLNLITKDIKEEYLTMDLIKRELEEKEINTSNYIKTFKEYNEYKTKREQLEQLEGYKVIFKNDLGTTIYSYSFGTLQGILKDIKEGAYESN